MTTHDSHGQVHHHISPIPVYLAIFSALLVLTVLTVIVSYLNLGAIALPIAMAVALVKAGLVVGYFMHLKFENRFYSAIFFGSVFFLFLLFAFTFIDLETRGAVVTSQDNFELRRDPKTGQIDKRIGVANPAAKNAPAAAPAAAAE